MTLNNMGIDFSAVGRHEEALRAEVEAVRLRRELLKTDPSINTHLASSFQSLGVKFQAAGCNEEALDTHEEAFAFVGGCQRRTQPSSGIYLSHWSVWR